MKSSDESILALIRRGDNKSPSEWVDIKIAALERQNVGEVERQLCADRSPAPLGFYRAFTLPADVRVAGAVRFRRVSWIAAIDPRRCRS